MSGAWRSAPLPWYVPSLQSCEAHWLAQVLERDGPVPVGITLADSEAQRWRATLRKVHDLRLDAPVGTPAPGPTDEDPALEAVLRAGIHLDTVSLARLADAAAPQAGLALDLLIDAHVLDDFLALAGEREPAIEVDSIGLAWRADAPRPPPMRSPLPHDAAPDTADHTADDTADDAAEGIDDKITDDAITDDAVIIAIIDDGIGIAHERFRHCASHTRVEYFLDMGTWATTPACAPHAEDFIGRTWTRAQIDRCLAESAGDEEAVYRAMGLLDARAGGYRPLRFGLSHGTHVLDVAAGEDFRQPSQCAPARSRPILAVQLPADVVADSSGAAMVDALRHALHWIEHHARRLSRRRGHGSKTPVPMVLNFSFGIFAGPHDGHGEVERELARFTERYGPDRCRVVLPSGNGFQARAYAQVLARRRPAITVPPWCVQPDGRTASFVQIWLPQGEPGAQQVAVSLTPPHGGPASTMPTKLGCMLDWRSGEHTLARIYHVQVPRPDGDDREQSREQCREMITIALRPSADANDDPRVCPSGR